MFRLTLSIITIRFFFFNDTATTEIYTLSLHDALPISLTSNAELHARRQQAVPRGVTNSLAVYAERACNAEIWDRSEEHTSELQSPCNLVCRLLLEKKKKQYNPQVGYKLSQHSVSTEIR